MRTRSKNAAKYASARVHRPTDLNNIQLSSLLSRVQSSSEKRLAPLASFASLFFAVEGPCAAPSFSATMPTSSSRRCSRRISVRKFVSRAIVVNARSLVISSSWTTMEFAKATYVDERCCLVSSRICFSWLMASMMGRIRGSSSSLRRRFDRGELNEGSVPLAKPCDGIELRLRLTGRSVTGESIALLGPGWQGGASSSVSKRSDSVERTGVSVMLAELDCPKSCKTDRACVSLFHYGRRKSRIDGEKDDAV